jgi:DNA-binding GntR family transcriptional regulator
MSIAASQLQVLQSKSLPSVVRDEILRFILHGTYSPGSKLGEEELAGILGVSRGPIREAFRSLEEAGLVHLSKNRGAFVRQLSVEEARELYVVRRGVDEMVGRLLAPQITGQQVAELRQMVEDMESSFAAQNIREYFPRDMAFHDRIAQMLDNSKLLEIYRRIVNEMHLVRLQSIQRAGGLLVSNLEHRAIVDALETRNQEATAQAMGRGTFASHAECREPGKKEQYRIDLAIRVGRHRVAGMAGRSITSIANPRHGVNRDPRYAYQPHCV